MLSNSKRAFVVSPESCTYESCDEMVVYRGVVLGFVRWGITWLYPISDFATTKGVKAYYKSYVKGFSGSLCILPTHRLGYEGKGLVEYALLYDSYKTKLVAEGLIVINL